MALVSDSELCVSFGRRRLDLLTHMVFQKVQFGSFIDCIDGIIVSVYDFLSLACLTSRRMINIASASLSAV